MHDVTLQINLSAGDIPYAQMTVPPLVEAHRATVSEKLAIVDCCRPQRTQVVDPDKRFPEPEFSRRVEQICLITEELKAKGYFDRIVYLRPNDPLLSVLSHKYLRNLVQETHDCGGCALMSYLVALEVPASRYILHYDADMLLYQAPGYDWIIEAKYFMERDPRVIAATPRVSPPFSKEKGLPDATSLHKGPPAIPVEGGWLVNWFSTRCFLIDRYKLFNYLPLPTGRLLLELLARKYLNRGYPMSPEVMLCRRVGGAGRCRLDLKSEKAWLLHPNDKSPRFLELLLKIQYAISLGKVPLEQRGYENIELSAWEDFLADSY